MKKLNITKERFEKSRYFQKKYGKLEYVNESGKMFKTDKGKVLMFKESSKPEWEIVKKGPDDWEEWEGDADERESFNVDIINDRKLWVKIMNCIRAFNDDKLYEAVTMPNKDNPDGKRQPNWDFIKAIEKAQWAITKELQADTDDNLIFLSDITKHISMNDLAQRLVDYVIEKQPTKSIARRLKKIGY